MRLLRKGVAVALIILPTLGTLTPFRVPCTSLDMRAFILSCCILFCHVWSLSLGVLLYSEGKQRDSRFEGGKGSWMCGRKAMDVMIHCMRQEFIFT